LLSVFLVLLLASSGARPSSAQGVCGDRAVDTGEQCDDGDLVNGDGCSSECRSEICGNGIVDEAEQCDSGPLNGIQGNDCSLACFFRFCGDGTTDPDRGEQCDVGGGNGEPGGSCAGGCKLNLQAASSSSSSSLSSSAASEEGGGTKGYWMYKPSVETGVTPAAVTPTVVSEAKAAAVFLAQPAAEDIKEYFTREENLALEGIIKKLSSGRRLKPAEREQAKELSRKFQETKTTERDRYVNLLKDFISTPVSSRVVADQNLSREKLSAPDLALAAAELKKIVKILPPETLKKKVVEQVAALKVLGVDIEPEIGAYEAELTDERAVRVFSALKSVKEAAEKRSTPDLKLSLLELERQASALLQAAPLLEREYGLKREELEPLVKSLNKAIGRAGKENVQRVIENVDRLISVFEQKQVITRSDIISLNIKNPHAAAAVRLAQDAGWRPEGYEVSGLINELADRAPEKYKNFFETGSQNEQKAALLDYLQGSDRLIAMLSFLNQKNRPDMEARYRLLLSDIQSVGNKNMGSGCEVSMIAALGCADDFMTDLEREYREADKIKGFIGMLQDLFGIGS